MSRLSKREKTIIKLMIVIAVVYVFFAFYIRPIIDEINSVKNKKYTLSFQIEGVKADIFALPDRQAENFRLSEVAQALFPLFEEGVDINDVDLFLTNASSGGGLMPMSFSISEITGLKTEFLTAYSVTLTAQGSEQSVFSFLENIRASGRFAPVSFHMTKLSDGYSLSMSLELFSITEDALT